MNEESKVRLAAQFYESRETARNLHGASYVEALKPWREAVRKVADAEHSGNELLAVTTIIKRLDDRSPRGGMAQGMRCLMVMAAAVEEMEAREAAQTPEQRAEEILESVFGKGWKDTPPAKARSTSTPRVRRPAMRRPAR